MSDSDRSDDTDELLGERLGPRLSDDDLSSVNTEPPDARANLETLAEIDRFLEVIEREDVRRQDETMSKYIHLLDDIEVGAPSAKNPSRNEGSSFRAYGKSSLESFKYDRYSKSVFEEKNSVQNELKNHKYNQYTVRKVIEDETSAQNGLQNLKYNQSVPKSIFHVTSTDQNGPESLKYNQYAVSKTFEEKPCSQNGPESLKYNQSTPKTASDETSSAQNAPESHKYNQPTARNIFEARTSAQNGQESLKYNQSNTRNIFEAKTSSQNGPQNMLSFNQSEFSSPMKTVPSESIKLLKDASLKSENLASFASMWNTTAKSTSNKADDASHKLDEEKSRRQHCESVIRKLQKKLLEERQKLAVAKDVDGTKDSIISKLKEACAVAVERWRATENSLELHRNEANCAIKNLNDQNEAIIQELDKRERLIESLKTSVRDVETIKFSLAEKDNRISELKDSNGMIVQLNKQLTDNLAKINAEKTKLLDELNQIKDNSASLQNEISQLKAEACSLSQNLEEQKFQNLRAENQCSILQKTNDEAVAKIKSIESEFENFKSKAEAQKGDLKSHYQKQVDSIVSNKVAEFQHEMERAISTMNEEMQNKEKEMSVQFARHLRKVEELHRHDLRIAEVKYEERLKSYKVQLDKSHQKVQQLEEKLVSIKNKRGEIAAQLHNVMESQWHQALKIITNGDPNDLQSTVGSDKNKEERNYEPSVSSFDECVKDEVTNAKTGRIDSEIDERAKPDFHSVVGGTQNYFRVFPKNMEGTDESEMYKNRLNEKNGILKSNKKNSTDSMLPSNKLIDNEKKSERSSRLKYPWK